MIQRAWQVVREPAVFASRAAAWVHRRLIRPWLPVAGPVLYAGIPTCHDRRLGDRLVPQRWRDGFIADLPAYESALVEGLREVVRPGDRVVVVGGGVGVTATVAALQAGASGRVQCYEGAGEGVEKVRCTARRNGVDGRLVVHHAIVARSIDVYGTAPAGAVVPPAELPDCDVLELDCEGAEVDILREMVIAPRVILVETHGVFGAPTPMVTELLESRGYRVSQRGPAESRRLYREYCEAHDIRVVVGVRAADAPPA